MRFIQSTDANLDMNRSTWQSANLGYDQPRAHPEGRIPTSWGSHPRYLLVSRLPTDLCCWRRQRKVSAHIFFLFFSHIDVVILFICTCWAWSSFFFATNYFLLFSSSSYRSIVWCYFCLISNCYVIQISQFDYHYCNLPNLSKLCNQIQGKCKNYL